MYNIKECGVSSIQLMERASIAVADELTTLCSVDTKIVVFAGSGNNGGDGLAVARLMNERGYTVVVYLFNTQQSLSPDCEQNMKRLVECGGVELHEVVQQFNFPTLSDGDLIVDALFGTGLNRPLESGYKVLVEFINKSPNNVVAIDIPSGMADVDSSADLSDQVIVKADATITFHCLKPCMLLDDSQRWLGRVKVVDIGLRDDHIQYADQPYTSTDAKDAAQILKPRNPFGHKGSFGHGLLVAGSCGMAGASILAGTAALRSGLGKLTISTPMVNLPILQTALPEAVVKAFDGTAEVNEGIIRTILAQSSAVAIGPGIGQSHAAQIVLRQVLSAVKGPIVIDADALNMLANDADWPTLLPQGAILTPHPKEMERLIGKKTNQRQQLQLAMDYSAKYGIYIILKGHYTAICTPDKHVYFNTTGNSGMATAGSGDVLTGILLSLLAQGYSIKDACRLGVWLHGQAGDYAARQFTQESMIASDIVKHISCAYKQIIQ